MKPFFRSKALQSKLFLALILLVTLAAGLTAQVRAGNPHLTLGNPSHAAADPDKKDNYLMEKEFFVLSYNNSKGAPNWVSWRLTKDDVGEAPRFAFFPDKELPQGFTRITPKDYTGSGFDRGHMCPHSDRSADNEMSQATFVMSNIIPQSPHVNEKAWAQLEMYCRDLVEHHRKTLYIICGPHGKGGEGKNGKKDTIGNERKVTVPAECWKVIIVLDAGRGDDIKKVNESTRLIAVIMPNDMSVGEGWADFRVSVKDVEKLTGYKFFDKVPDSVIEPLKEEVDDEAIPSPESAHH
jgi:endonuclease G